MSLPVRTRPQMAPDQMTLFVDASYCHQSKAAGWGAWAMRSGWDFGKLKSGPINTAESPSEAELMGIGSAILMLEGQGYFEGLGRVLIQSDCVRALQVLEAHGAEQSAVALEFLPLLKKNFSEGEQRVIAAMQGFTDRTGIKLRVRHVKGHTNQTSRSRVNAQCDALAREHMEAMRKVRGHRRKRQGR